MTLKVYAIKDTKVGFMTPFYLQNDAVALRAFKNAINDKTPNNINQNTEDMELWYLGEFNDQTGEIIGVQGQAKHLAKGADVKEN